MPRATVTCLELDLLVASLVQCSVLQALLCPLQYALCFVLAAVGSILLLMVWYTVHGNLSII